MSEFRITKKQQAYLDSLVCQRISDDEANKQVVDVFENRKSSPGIIDALKKGWNKDKQDKVAFYIIKDPKDNQPLLFFSLQCGEMHQPLIPEKLTKAVLSAVMVLKAAAVKCGVMHYPTFLTFGQMLQYRGMIMKAQEIARNLEVEDWAKDVIEKQLENGTLPEEVWNNIWLRIFKSMFKEAGYKAEMELEGENIIRTKKTFAGVELVHFCAHEPARDKWKAMGMSQSLGQTMFWQFIEPKIREIRDLVGCEYIYLFAADKNRNGRLVNTYKKMGFDFREDINVTKPAYDFCCYFMCQEVKSLRTRRNAFFREFNKPEEPRKN